MDIHGKITGIKYTPLLTERLRQVDFNDFDVNAVPTTCIVKDGILKMILFSNLGDVTVEGKSMKSSDVLRLTSPKIKGQMTTLDSQEIWKYFLEENIFDKSREQWKINCSRGCLSVMSCIFAEARKNNFIVQIQYSK
jgi:hypothetical protein